MRALLAVALVLAISGVAVAQFGCPAGFCTSGGGTGGGGGSGNHLVTEGGDNLITEDGSQLVTE